MSEYDKTIRSLNNRLGNDVRLMETKNVKQTFVGFNGHDLMNCIKPYSIQLSTFMAVFVLLLIFRPVFVLRTVIVDGFTEKKVCLRKVLMWSIVAVIVVSLLIQLYMYKMEKQQQRMFYG